MVTLLAKNAVQIKCGFENAIMTGNYECAYALGVLCAISGQQQYENYGNIIELKKKVFDNMGQFSSDDKKIKSLKAMNHLNKWTIRWKNYTAADLKTKMYKN